MKKLLVVDDNLAMLEILKLALQDDFEVFTAACGEVCLSSIEAIKPEVILTDQEMHGLTGLELIRIIRQKYHAIPVFLFSSRLDKDLIEKAISAGAKGWIGKPFILEELRRLLKRD